MHRSRARIAALVASAAFLLSGSLTGALAAGGTRAPGVDAVEHEFGRTIRKVRGFWTRERMKEALPLTSFRSAGPVTTDGWSGAHGIAAPDLRAAAEEAPFERREVTDPAAYPYRLHGKLFVRAEGAEYHCSATALESANESVVFTAAHCLFGRAIGGWVDSVAFVPGYRFAKRPYGTWVAQSAFVTPGWLDSETARADIGALVMAPHEGSTLNDAIGGRSIAFGQEREQAFEIFGYPAQGGYDGERLYVCEASTYWRDPTPAGTGPDPIGVGCDMTQGSSGGGWVINGSALNSINSYGYRDGSGDELPYMFGPYFGSFARSLFGEAESVHVALPEPLPSSTATPPIEPSPTPTVTPAPIPSTGVASIADANDSRGSFDIARVRVARDEASVVVGVRTHDAWRLRLLSPAFPRNAVFVDFDSLGDDAMDRYLAVFSRDGRLVGKMVHYLAGEDEIVGDVTVRRTSRRSFAATIPSSLLASDGKLRWMASSHFKTPTRCARMCRDLAPDRGSASL